MWCRHCQQQTPALGPPSGIGPRCGRCGRTTPREATASTASSRPDLSDPDDSRRAIYRTLRSAHATISAGEAASTLRYDMAHTPLAEAYHAQPTVERRSTRSAKTPPPRPSVVAPVPRGHLAAWLVTSFGAATLGVGIGLGAWSLLGQRPGIWNLALAATLAGQGIMILGLVQLLASLFHTARNAMLKLAQMHDELRRLRRLADESAGRHQASAANFYADLARDAPPERMMGHLRGQMDRLASRLRVG